MIQRVLWRCLFSLFFVSVCIAQCSDFPSLLWDKGIPGTPYPGKLCTPSTGCVDTVNHQVFFCFNYGLRIGVECRNSTWDPISNGCGITEMLTYPCTTKACITPARLAVIDAYSMPWMCLDPLGNQKLCGEFISNVDKLVFIGDTEGEFSGQMFQGKNCAAMWDSWEGKPESMTFSLF